MICAPGPSPHRPDNHRVRINPRAGCCSTLLTTTKNRLGLAHVAGQPTLFGTSLSCLPRCSPQRARVGVAPGPCRLRAMRWTVSNTVGWGGGRHCTVLYSTIGPCAQRCAAPSGAHTHTHAQVAAWRDICWWSGVYYVECGVAESLAPRLPNRFLRLLPPRPPCLLAPLPSTCCRRTASGVQPGRSRSGSRCRSSPSLACEALCSCSCPCCDPDRPRPNTENGVSIPTSRAQNDGCLTSEGAQQVLAWPSRGPPLLSMHPFAGPGFDPWPGRHRRHPSLVASVHERAAHAAAAAAAPHANAPPPLRTLDGAARM